MRLPTPAAWFVAAMLASSPAMAGVVIYRCTDAFGAVTVQNDVPCPKGSKQQKQVVEPPPPMPAYRPTAAPVAPPPAAPAPVPIVAATERLPPPPLFQCSTYDNDSYLSENGAPPSRCVPLQTVGLDGSFDTATGAACQVVADQCQRVADGDACAAWQRHLREVETAWKFGRAENVTPNEAEYERVARILRESTCGQ